MDARTVLVAEDHPAMAELIVELLTAVGLKAVVSADPVEVRRWLDEERAPVVLDGSVFNTLGLLLEDLPGHVVVYSADDVFVESARAWGLHGYVKGSASVAWELARAVQAQVGQAA